MKRKGILFVFVFLCTLMISGCGNRSGHMAAFPFVKINHSIYTLDSAGTVIAELPDGYTEIGVITENVSAADGAPDGASSCCKVGEKVYQSSANTHEILVHTKLFSESGEYRYVRFNKR